MREHGIAMEKTRRSPGHLPPSLLLVGSRCGADEGAMVWAGNQKTEVLEKESSGLEGRRK